MSRYLKEKPGERAAAIERSRKMRWKAPGAAKVTDKLRGSVVVPHASKFAALLCAAEVWWCSWMDLEGASVWKADPSEPVAERPTII